MTPVFPMKSKTFTENPGVTTIKGQGRIYEIVDTMTESSQDLQTSF